MNGDTRTALNSDTPGSSYPGGIAPLPAAGVLDPVSVINDHISAREVRVPIRSTADVVTARQRGRSLASLAGFSASDLTIIATAISEVTRNIVEYSGEGEVAIALVTHGHRTGLRIVASDEGPGIADVSLVMRDGYSTANGLGIGLPGARRLMDEFDIESALGHGTTVTMRKWL